MTPQGPLKQYEKMCGGKRRNNDVQTDILRDIYLDPTEINEIVGKIHSSRKYAPLCEETIRDIVIEEIHKTGSLKQLQKRARQRLHRVYASYLGEVNLTSAYTHLKETFATDEDDRIRQACASIMSEHRSSAERLNILPIFYERIFRFTGYPEKIFDLACSLNPFSFRWMSLPPSILYYAYDINCHTVELINYYFLLEGLKPLAQVRDVLCSPAKQYADVSFLFKMYHCLEHRKRGAGWYVVEHTPSRWVAVSFPTRTLVSRRADILGNYDKAIFSRAGSLGWAIERLDFDTEIVLLIKKE